MTGYPLERIYEEVAFLAYYLHWDHQALMDMDHKERQRWCHEVGRIHQKLSGKEEQHSLFQM